MNDAERDAIAQQTYARYWAPILEDENGVIDPLALKIELHNALVIMTEYAGVYNFVSNGKLSNSVSNYLGAEAEQFLRGENGE